MLCREDYTRLFEFVSEKNLRVKNKGKVPQQKANYNDELSSESDHDAYLERMKAEGEEKDSEDGVYLSLSLSLSLSLPFPYTHSLTPFLGKVTFFFSIITEDSDFVAKESGTDDDLE